MMTEQAAREKAEKIADKLIGCVSMDLGGEDTGSIDIGPRDHEETQPWQLWTRHADNKDARRAASEIRRWMTDAITAALLTTDREAREAAGEFREQRDEISDEMEKCHRLLDKKYGLSPETTSMDTLESRLVTLIEEIDKGRFIESRSAMTGRLLKAYPDEELAKMFAPWWASRDVTGLSPREVRLLETIVDRNIQIRDGRKLTCIYCGHEYPFDGVSVEELDKHVRRCPKHPIATLREEILSPFRAANLVAPDGGPRRVLGQVPNSADGCIVGADATIWRINDAGEPYSYVICRGWLDHVYGTREAAAASTLAARGEVGNG